MSTKQDRDDRERVRTPVSIKKKLNLYRIRGNFFIGISRQFIGSGTKSNMQQQSCEERRREKR